MRKGGEIVDNGRAVLAPTEIKRNDIVGATIGRPLVAQHHLHKHRGYLLFSAPSVVGATR